MSFNTQLWIPGFVLERNCSTLWGRCLRSWCIRRLSESLMVDSEGVVSAVSLVAQCGVGRSPCHWPLLVPFLLAQIFQPVSEFALSTSFLQVGISTTLPWPNHKPPSSVFPSQYFSMHLLRFLAHLILFYLKFSGVFM